MSSEAAEAFFVAARNGDRVTLQAAIARLVPSLATAIRRTLRRHESLVRRCRLEMDDVVQRVFERMLVSPPSNPNGLDAVAVLTTWARAVAVNHLLDTARRAGREVSSYGSEEGVAEPARSARDRAALETALETGSAPQEQRLRTQQGWVLACECADRELSHHKHLRELFYALAEDPELSARDLARKIGLLPAADEGDEHRARRAEQYVWKLRERVHTRLADYLDRAERLPATPLSSSWGDQPRGTR